MLRKQLHCSKKVQGNGSKGLKVKGTYKEVDKHEQHLNVSVDSSIVVSRNQNKNFWACVFKQNNWGDKTQNTETCQVTQHDMTLVQGQQTLVCMV